MEAPVTYAVYVLDLEPTGACVHHEPYDYYVGSTHETQAHPASARVGDHLDGHKSKVVKSGYNINGAAVVEQGLATREAAQVAEGAVARDLRRQGFKVWCDR